MTKDARERKALGVSPRAIIMELDLGGDLSCCRADDELECLIFPLSSFLQTPVFLQSVSASSIYSILL